MNKLEKEIVDSLLIAYEKATPEIDQKLVNSILALLYTPEARKYVLLTLLAFTLCACEKRQDAGSAGSFFNLRTNGDVCTDDMREIGRC